MNKNQHWLLYTTHREFGGTKILGIFDNSDDAWSFYDKTHDLDERFYTIAFVELWENENKKEVE